MSLEARLHRLEEEVRRLGIRPPDPDDDLNYRIVRALVLAHIDMENRLDLIRQLLELRSDATEAQARDFLCKRVFLARLRAGTVDHFGRERLRVVVPPSLEAQVWERALELQQQTRLSPRLMARLHVHRAEAQTIVLTDDWCQQRRCG